MKRFGCGRTQSNGWINTTLTSLRVSFYFYFQKLFNPLKVILVQNIKY